jgi:hypothetical protein
MIDFYIWQTIRKSEQAGEPCRVQLLLYLGVGIPGHIQLTLNITDR